MGKKALLPLAFRGNNEHREKVANGKGEGMVRAPSSSAATSLNEELESGREKEMAQKRPVPLKLNKAEACKIKKAPISPPTVQRKVKVPVVIQTLPPKVIQIDPSNFMRLVQKLTGLSSTSSRCEKRRPQGADDLIYAQTETLPEGAIAEVAETEMFLAETVISETSTDEEDSVPIQSNLEEAVSGFPESLNVTPVKDNASSRGSVPPFDWLWPSIAADEFSFTMFPAASLPFSSYPDSLGIFTVPIQEPSCDLFGCSFSVPTDPSFNSLSDLPLLSPPRLDGFIS